MKEEEYNSYKIKISADRHADIISKLGEDEMLNLINHSSEIVSSKKIKVRII